MKKSFLKLALAALTIGLLGSCSKINERLDNLDKRVDGIENEQIASINTQITNINSSIADLGQIRSDISSLKQSAENHGQEIFALQEADETLGNRIVNLETYLDEVLPTFAETEWVEATFSTLEQYEETCDAIAEIDAKIGTTSEKLSKDIKACADSLTKWVNKQFEGYYTAAQMDAKLAQMKSAIDSSKASGKISDAKVDSIAAELAKTKTAVDTAKANIRAEYKAAVKSAIETSEGKLTKALNDAIATVNGKITSLTGRVDALETSVADLKGRVDKLEAAIGAYTELQGTITEIIKKLLADVGDKPQNEQDTTIWKCITALQAQCGTFSTAIQTLQGRVGNKDVATQISEAIAELVTAQKLTGLADAVSKLKDIVDVNVNDVKSLTQQIADINEKLSTTYVTKTQLGEDIAAAKAGLQKQIDSLCNVIGKDGTAETATGIFKKIAELNAKVAALEAVKITIESTKYTNWSDAVQAVLNKVDALGIGNISGLQSALNDLEARLDKIEAMIQSVSIIPAYSDGTVKAVDGILTLKCIVSPAEALIGMESLKDSLLIYADSVEVKTKAAPACMKIKVEDASILDEELGVITLTADISESLPKGEDKALTVALHIKNGISDFTTEFVPVYVSSTTTGTAKATIGELQFDVKWIQLWENGPKFAEYNVGVTNGKAESYGGYYTWGGIYNNDPDLLGFLWTDDHNSLHTTDNDNLTSTEDTATKLWGENWRMPTKAELEALINSTNCTVEWTTVGGVNGRKFTGKGAYASNSVFLPAAGNCHINEDGEFVHTSGSSAYYWSSTANGSSGAYGLFFFPDQQIVEHGYRSHGYSVRAVLAE